MLYCEDIINERLSQKDLVLCPLVLTVQNIFAAVNRIDLSGTPCSTSAKSKHSLKQMYYARKKSSN